MADSDPVEAIAIAGLAHELRNVLILPLTIQVDLAERALRQGNHERLRELLAEIADLARHGEAAVDRLRHNARLAARVAPERRAVSPNELARRAAAIARTHIRAGHAATTIVIDEVATATIDADERDVIAALVNVISNAADALGAGGGTVRVRTGGDEHGTWIEVSDDGPGMAPAIRTRATEAFFTTKPDGSGIGLALVEACMQRHGGTLELDSERGGGTRVRLRFG